MAKIILFEDANFNGDARVIKDSDVADLETIDFNDELHFSRRHRRRMDAVP